jgi:hypothetical protein
MSDTAVLSQTLQYTGPFGAVVATTDHIEADYDGLSSGNIDVPASAAAGSSYDIPLGSIAKPKFLVIRNDTLVQIGVSILTGGSTGPAEPINITAGGQLAMAMPDAISAASGPTGPISAVSVALAITAPTGDATQIGYMIAGD